MNKKFLSGLVAGIMTLSSLAIPTYAEEDAGTLTVTYNPENHVIRYGSAANSNTKRQEIAVNAKPAQVRTDQDEEYIQFSIPAPEAVEKIELNIPVLRLQMKTVDVLDEEGVATGEKEIVEAMMGTDIYYVTEALPLPEDGEYYLYDDTAMGGTVEYVTNLLEEWKNYLWRRKLENSNKVSMFPTIVSPVVPSAFGVTDATTSNKNYSVTKDITDLVLEGMVADAGEDGLADLGIIYGPPVRDVWSKNRDYYMGQSVAENNTLTVTYNVDDLMADINSVETADELKDKIYEYAPMFGISLDSVQEKVIDSKIGSYVGTTFTFESFKAMIKAMETVDITSYQADLSDMFNLSNWGILGEKITSDTFAPVYTFPDPSNPEKQKTNGVSGAFVFNPTATLKDTYTFEAFDTVKETDAEGNVTYSYPANGDKVEFKFDTETFSANVDNLVMADFGEAIEIEDHARYAKKIYFLSANFNNHRWTMPVTVTYADGTVETKTVNLTNRGQAGWDQNECYAGDFGVNANRLGNKTWEEARASTEPDADGDYYVTSTSSSGGILLYGIDVDETKIIDKVSFANASTTALILYGYAESVMSNAELEAYIDKVEALESVTADNAKDVLIADDYADELVARNVYLKEDFAELNALVEDARWYDGMVDGETIMLDISDKRDADVLMPVGTVSDTKPYPFSSDKKAYLYNGINTSKWTAASTSYNNGLWAKSTYAGGVRTITEYEYVVNEEESTEEATVYDIQETGYAIPFATPEEMLAAGVKDAIELVPGEEPTVIPASGVPVEKLYFMWDAAGASQRPQVKVNYSDGSEQLINPLYMSGYGWTFVNSNNIKSKLYPYLCGGVHLASENYGFVENDEGKYVVTELKNSWTGLNMYGVELDSTKTPVSYELIPDSAYGTVVYAITERTMSNDDMKAVIEEAEALEYVSTEEEAVLAKTAAAYAAELDRRHAVMISDNQTAVELAEQAIAQEVKYIDLTEYANVDLIAKLGDTEMYTTRDDSIYADLPEYITAKDRENDKDYLSDPEAGTVYKLSGGFNGKGNDAVLVKPVDENGSAVTIDLDEKMYKHLSFLVDCIDTGISAQTGGTIYATVNYKDGTSEEIEVLLRRGDSWYTNQMAAHYTVSFDHYDAETGAYVDGGRVVGTNKDPDYVAAYPTRSSEGMSVFGFDIPTFKNVSSVTLNPHAAAEYSIIALTATPYTNDELVEKIYDFEELEILDAEEVTAENAQTVLDYAYACDELYVRNYQYVDEITLEDNEPLRAAATTLLMPATVSFAPVISFSGANATANLTMINTSASDEDYALIIALYNNLNQLVAVKRHDKVLKAGTVSGTDSISVELTTDAVLCKAMVWDSLGGMYPYAVTSEKIK